MNAGLSRTVRFWGMVCHLPPLLWVPIVRASYESYAAAPDPAIIFFYLSSPFLILLITLLVWLSQRRRHPFVDQQGKESINFQLSVLTYFLIGWLMMTLIVLTTFGMPPLQAAIDLPVRNTLTWTWQLYAILLGLIAIGLVSLMVLIETIAATIAAIRVYRGRSSRYALTLRLFRR